MTIEEFAQVKALIEEEYGVAFSEDRELLWFHRLKGYPAELVREAVGRCIERSPYRPQLANLMEHLRPTKDEERDARTSGAALAWLHARAAIADPYRSHLFEDRAVPLAIEALGGIYELSQKESDELDTFTRKEFERIHSALAATGRAHPSGYAVGLVETTNRTVEGGLDALVDVVKVGGPDDGAVLRMLTRHTDIYRRGEEGRTKGAIPAHIELTE